MRKIAMIFFVGGLGGFVSRAAADDAQTVALPASSATVGQFLPPAASTITADSVTASTQTVHHHHHRVSTTPPLTGAPNTAVQASMSQEQRVAAQRLDQSIRSVNAQQWASFKATWAAQESAVMSNSSLTPDQKRAAMMQVQQQKQAAAAQLNQRLNAGAAQQWATFRKQWGEGPVPLNASPNKQ